MNEIVIQKDRWEEADLQGALEFELLDDLPEGKTCFVGVGANELEIELVEGCFGEEVGAGGKAF